jgi:hypothetical protein
MQDRYNLEVEKPEQVPVVLETVANFYRETGWTDLATILDSAARSCRALPLSCATCPEGASGPWCANCKCGR